MKKHYPWLWFDADNTLFDYNHAEVTALQKSFQKLGLIFDARYMDIYRGINQKLWQALERQEIKPDVLRVRRFELLFDAINMNGSAEDFSAAYVEQLGLCANLIDGAYEVLNALHGVCKFAIVTNGLQTVQRSRLEHSTIKHFISELIISEEIGSAKPHAAFFDIALARTGNPPKRDVLIVGDSLSSDIQGGANYGIDTCWFNPTAELRPDNLQITFEIQNLPALLKYIN